MIYFARILNDDGFIKIGFSFDPAVRIKQIGFDACSQLELLASAPGCPWLERHVHHILAADMVVPNWPGTRVGKLHPPREWFRPSCAVMRFVDGVKQTGALPFGFMDTIPGQIVARHERGEKPADIARVFGISRQRVGYSIEEVNRRRRLGWAPFAPTQTAA